MAISVAMAFGGTPYDHMEGGAERLIYNYSAATMIQLSKANAALEEMYKQSAAPDVIYDQKRRIRFLKRELEIYG